MHKVENLAGTLVEQVKIEGVGSQPRHALFDGLVLCPCTVALGLSQFDLMPERNVAAKAALTFHGMIGEIADHADAQQ